MTYIDNEKFLSEGENPTEDGNPSEVENPTEGETPSEGENPTEDGNPSEVGDPSEGENPTEDGNPSEVGDPSEGGNPSEGETPSGNGNPSETDIQEILDNFHARFEVNEEDLTDLTESIRSLVDLMSIEPYSTPGYVFTPPDIPTEGYREWEYPIIVDYLVTVVGYGEPLPQSNDYENPDQFLEDFQEFAYECYKGVTFSEFYIDKVWGADGKKLYDSQGMEETEPEPEEPAEDLTPAILETLRSVDAHLGTIEETLDGIASVSGNTLEYYEDTLRLYKEQNEYLTNVLALNMALLFLLVVAFGHKVAHAFWQRMRVG